MKIFKGKYVDKSKINRLTTVLEGELLKSLDHPNIVKFFEEGESGYIEELIDDKEERIGQDFKYLVVEYVETNLYLDLCSQCGSLGEMTGLYLFRQMVDLFSYLHTYMNVVHLDVKALNFLVNNNLQVKIVDFGYSRRKQIDKIKAAVGTKMYMAPEIIQGEVFDGRRADIFSLGVTLFMMVTGRAPFQDAHMNDDKYQNMQEDPINYRKQISECCLKEND